MVEVPVVFVVQHQLDGQVQDDNGLDEGHQMDGTLDHQRASLLLVGDMRGKKWEYKLLTN